jgi:hypothetical protein
MPAGGGDFDRPFDMLLPFDLPEIKFPFSESGVEPAIRRAHRFQDYLATQKLHDLR